MLSHALTFPAWGEQLKKVVFVPQWLPQAQFAGYYVAKEKGIYKKYGIDITILRGGPDYIPSVMLT
ncbi:MAG: ABC transporter substrate-binding protein, partial [Proteobacteria bacterium]|nr:ABC transporter substrate-binding protein [Pseudomonadota bacterium]